MNLTDSGEFIVLDHGTGAKLSSELIDLIIKTLGDVYAGEMEDGAILGVETNNIVMTTDSFVVSPHIFGNGDIGKIAICGTVNDLAVMGADPQYLTLSLIMEVGFPIAELKRILNSARECAIEAGVRIVAGDTKIVAKGEADKIFINTAGIGVLYREPLRMRNVIPGDELIVTSWLGNHSVHLLSIREGLGFETRVLSDCAPLNKMISELIASVGGGIKSMRDITRGGLSAVLHEYARKIGRNICFWEEKLPIQMETIMAADMLGIDAINLANEGCLAIFVSPESTEKALKVLRSSRYGVESRVVGKVLHTAGGNVEKIRKNREVQILDELLGAELPRLC